MIFRLLTLIAALVTVGSLGQTAQATVMLKMGLDGLVGRADKIVIGKVESQDSRWTSDRRYIVTDMVVRVSQTLEGKAEEKVTVRRLGGVVNGVGMKVVGSTVLQPGQEVLLFSHKRGRHRFIVGMRQGVYHLQRNAGGRTLVGRRLQGLTLAKQKGPNSPLELHQDAQHEVQPDNLDDFLLRLRETIKRCAVQPQRCRDK